MNEGVWGVGILLLGSVLSGGVEMAGKLRVSAVEIEQNVRDFKPGLPSLLISAEGEASVNLSVVREKSRAERHVSLSHSYLVLGGSGEVFVGGRIPDEQEISSGEFRGDRLEGAVAVPLHKGDLVWIPRNAPHTVVPGPDGVSMLVFRNHIK